MSKVETKPGVKPWEYLVYGVVTVSLLAIGLFIWLFSLILRLAALFKRRERHG